MTRTCIFAVDDDELMGELMTVEIAAGGYDVRTYSSIGLAMAHMQAAQPALLILDLNMPEMGGLEALTALHAQGLLERTAVLVLSGLAEAGIREQALSAGASDYLVKPVTGSALRAAVSRLLTGVSVPQAAAGARSARPQSADGQIHDGHIHDGQINPVVTDLMRAYGQPTVARLLKLLSADLNKLQSDLPADREATGQVAHAIKGAAASLGFVAVEIACAALEHACQMGGSIEVLVRQAANACARARQEIDHHLHAAA